MSKRQKDFMYFLIKYKGYTSIEAGILASILVKYWLLSKGVVVCLICLVKNLFLMK